MIDEVVAKEQLVPVAGKCRRSGDHVQVMRASTGRVSLDEPCVEGRDIIAQRRTPEVVIALSLQCRCDLQLREIEIADLDEHVNDRLRGQPRNCGAAEVLNATNHLRERSKQMLLL